MMTDEEMERLALLLTDKMRRGVGMGRGRADFVITELDLHSIVSTTIADTALVIEGAATIDDYANPDEFASNAFVGGPPLTLEEMTDDELRARLGGMFPPPSRRQRVARALGRIGRAMSSLGTSEIP